VARLRDDDHHRSDAHQWLTLPTGARPTSICS
jgi:hypothetical protein